ncbi:MAG: hypothetical protein M1834_006527 [Cirrosporium novae-zelandiae]|nr:MAG: hypothetical protein M1834_006527 [Cirrosporium novae-zelandiae]
MDRECIGERMDSNESSAAGSQAQSIHSDPHYSQRRLALIGAATYPSRSGYSETHQRYTSSILPGKFGDRVSQGSDPTLSARQYDPYREALNNSEPPSKTKMGRLYNGYKPQEESAVQAGEVYKYRVKTSKVAKSDIKKDKESAKRDGTPRKYNGDPL